MIKDELPGRPLSNPAGRNGVAEVLPPGQHAAEQAQRLPRAGGALQDAVDFLNGVSNEVTGQQGAALQTARPAKTGPAARQTAGPLCSGGAHPTGNGRQRDTPPPSPESQRLRANSAPVSERCAQHYSELNSVSQPNVRGADPLGGGRHGAVL